MVTITIVVWLILAWTLFVFVPHFQTMRNGFEFEENVVSRQYIFAYIAASKRWIPRVVNAAVFFLAGSGFQVVLIETIFPRRGRMTALPRLQRVVMWLLILMPLWVALLGLSAMGLDLFKLMQELS